MFQGSNPMQVDDIFHELHRRIRRTSLAQIGLGGVLHPGFSVDPSVPARSPVQTNLAATEQSALQSALEPQGAAKGIADAQPEATITTTTATPEPVVTEQSALQPQQQKPLVRSELSYGCAELVKVEHTTISELIVAGPSVDNGNTAVDT